MKSLRCRIGWHDWWRSWDGSIYSRLRADDHTWRFCYRCGLSQSRVANGAPWTDWIRPFVLLMLLCAPAYAAPRSFPLTLTLPAYDYARDDSTACGGEGDTLTDLKWLRIYGYRFGSAGTGDSTLLATHDVAGREGQPYDFEFLALDSTHVTYAILFVRAVDDNGKVAPVGPCSQVLYAIPPWAEEPEREPGLLGEYFDNEDLTAPYATRVDSLISWDWDYAAPIQGMGVETFSMRWTGFIDVPQQATYTFRVRVEDGVRLWIDGAGVVSNWGVQEEHDATGSVTLSAGLHAFKLEYMHNGGDAVLRLYWSRSGAAEEVVPKEAFSH